jgi:hypothetical protein
MRRAASLVGLCLLFLLVAWPSPSAAAGSRPFKGRVSATWDNVFNGLPVLYGGAPPANFEGGGQVTHMGKTTQTGTLTLEPIDFFFVEFLGSGSVTITAANGDQLTFEYEGLLNAVTGEGSGTFTFIGGTGRFANATGGGEFDALIDVSLPDNQPMTVVLDGRIDY